MGDLLAGARVVAAGAGVDDLVAEVLVVFVASADDDGIATVSFGAADAAHGGAVYAGLGQRLPGRPGSAEGSLRNFAEESVGHGSSCPVGGWVREEGEG